MADTKTTTVKVEKTTTPSKEVAKVVKKISSTEAFNVRWSKTKAKSFEIAKWDVVLTTPTNGQNPISVIKIAAWVFRWVERILAKTPTEFIEEWKTNSNAKKFEKTYWKVDLEFLSKMIAEKKPDSIITMNLSKWTFKQERA